MTNETIDNIYIKTTINKSLYEMPWKDIQTKYNGRFKCERNIMNDDFFIYDHKISDYIIKLFKSKPISPELADEMISDHLKSIRDNKLNELGL